MSRVDKDAEAVILARTKEMHDAERTIYKPGERLEWIQVREASYFCEVLRRTENGSYLVRFDEAMPFFEGRREVVLDSAAFKRIKKGK